jgi:hypothetical protein
MDVKRNALIAARLPGILIIDTLRSLIYSDRIPGLKSIRNALPAAARKKEEGSPIAAATAVYATA